MTASRALLLAQWAWREGGITRLWKAIHTAPVATMAFDPTSTLLATGRAADRQVGWRIRAGLCTHTVTSNTFPQVAVMGLCVSGTLCGTTGHTTFGARLVLCSEWGGGGQVGRGTPWAAHLICPTPVCSLVAFHPDPTRLLLFSSAVDSAIRVWSLQDRSCLVMLTAHYSAVTSLGFSADGHTMLRSAASLTGEGRRWARTGGPGQVARTEGAMSPQLWPRQDLRCLGPSELPGHKDCARI